MILADIHDLTTTQLFLTAYIGYLVFISLITFILYALDKRKAKYNTWRISEATLLFLSLCGGAFGGLPAMLIFRHKTKKEHWYFTFLNILGLVIHITLIFLFIFVFDFSKL